MPGTTILSASGLPASYTITLPAAIGVVGDALEISAVVGSVASTSFVNNAIVSTALADWPVSTGLTTDAVNHKITYQISGRRMTFHMTAAWSANAVSANIAKYPMPTLPGNLRYAERRFASIAYTLPGSGIYAFGVLIRPVAGDTTNAFAELQTAYVFALTGALLNAGAAGIGTFHTSGVMLLDTA